MAPGLDSNFEKANWIRVAHESRKEGSFYFILQIGTQGRLRMLKFPFLTRVKRLTRLPRIGAPNCYVLHWQSMCTQPCRLFLFVRSSRINWLPMATAYR
jgi:hypothetical protein